jgi:hypothetical protein
MAGKKKTVTKKRSAAAHKGDATRKRNELTSQLRADLQASKETLKAANAAAKAEITVLKDQLNAVMKREKALLKVSEQKAKIMWKAAEQWEKKQVAKIQKMFHKAPKA